MRISRDNRSFIEIGGRIMNLDNKKKTMISIILIIILIISFIIYLIMNNSEDNALNWEEDIIMQNTQNEENRKNKIGESTNEIEEEEIIVVHITGEVKKEGILYLAKGARIADAIKEAGGETDEADLSQVNLAYKLQDGQKIYIPNKNEKVSMYITDNGGNNIIEESNNTQNGEKGGSKKVNINTASQSELDSLPGIGPALAQNIIDYREENGGFKSIEELQNVKGIGDAKYDDIKDNVTI